MLEPHHLGAKLIEKVKEKITSEVEGQCLGANGYVIQIVDYQNIIPGSIDIDTGAVQVTVLYEAILMRPFKNEVLDAIVTSATNEVSNLYPFALFFAIFILTFDKSNAAWLFRICWAG